MYVGVCRACFLSLLAEDLLMATSLPHVYDILKQMVELLCSFYPGIPPLYCYTALSPLLLLRFLFKICVKEVILMDVLYMLKNSYNTLYTSIEERNLPNSGKDILA